MTMDKVALVTGANRGIGLEICRQLCQSWNGIVVLTARNAEKGKAAVADLAKEGLTARFLQLDVSSVADIQRTAEEFKAEFGELDILINNAGIFMTGSALRSGQQTYSQQVENTLSVNYFGLLNVCNHFFPFLRPHARVVHVSSALGDLKDVLCEELQKKFCSPNLTISELSGLMNSYISDVKENDYEKNGWPRQPTDTWMSVAYRVSKIAVTTLAHIQAKQFLEDPREDILVNACCPGWVKTDMGGPNAQKTVAQGAAVPVKMALLPHGGHSGKFYTEYGVKNFFTF